MQIQRDKFDMMQAIIVAGTLVTCILVWTYFTI